MPELPLIGETPEKLFAIINTLTNWIFAGLVVFAAVMVLLVAFQFVREGENAEKMEEARRKLIWAVVGIILAFLSKGFVPVIKNIIGA